MYMHMKKIGSSSKKTNFLHILSPPPSEYQMMDPCRFIFTVKEKKKI